MAFDQNTVPIDLRFLNVASTMAEDARVVALTGRNTIEGFYANPRDGGSPNSIPLYYPSTISDAGLLGVGCGSKIPGASGWLPVMPTTVINPATISTATAHCYNPNPDLGSRTCSNVSDQVSDEGGDDSLLSGKRLKFMCSFGGKILPRPSDGTLRYVGGQTRIISVRKEVSYYELVQKLADIYGQNLVIKYQLPEEDLDALVSVSCQDDLINMMDEYNKLVERSSDASSSKLRVFLFSTSELDSPSLGDLESSGQRYVEAVNGIGDGAVTGGGSIMRRDSITSASTINSDGGNEGVDNLTHSQGNFSGPPSTDESSPRGNFTTSSQETSPRLVCLDTNPTTIYVDASSCAPLAIPVVKSQILSPRNEQEFERSSIPVNMQRQQMGYYDFPQHGGGNFAPSGSYFIDPHQKVLNRSEYVQQLPSQTGHHPSTTSTIYTQQQYHNDNHHYIPAIQMPMNHSAHVRIRPNSVRPTVHTQQIPFECYPEQVNHYHGDNTYNTYQSQVAPSMAFSDGWVAHQQVKFYDKTPKYEDCFMCQKALPHTHSDTVATNDQRDSPPSTLSSPNSVYEDNARVCPTNKATVDPIGEKQGGGCYQNFEPLYEIDKTDHSKVGVARLTGGKQSPYGVVMGTIPQLCQENIVQQVVVPTQYIKQEDLMSKPIYEDNSPVGVVRTSSTQILDHQYFHESPKDYSAELRGINPITSESCLTYDIRPIDRKVKNLQITPPEVVLTTEIKSPIDHLTKEQHMDNTSGNVKMVIESNVLKRNQLISCPLSESPMVQSFRPIESYEVPYISSPAFSGGDSSHLTEKISPNGELKDITSQFQAQMVHSDMDNIPSSGKFSSISTANKVGDTTESSNSLFSNQHPWNLRHDTHFRPPKSNKTTIKNETFGTTDPFSCSRLSRESPMHNSGSSIAEMHLEDGVYDTSYNSTMDFGQEQVRCIKGLAEERINQDLQAVAEGVAVSVLQPIMNLNSQSNFLGRFESFEANHNNEIKNIDTETRHGDKFEDITAKITEKANLGSPVSGGPGRLQIIKDCDLEELRELGSGTFGTVYHGKWRGSDVAIKRINDRCFAGKPSEQERMRDDFWNEAIKLADLHHPNVVAFYGVVLDGPEETVATVTEYMANGSLRNAIEKNERNLDSRKRLIIAMDVAFGMEYLHGKNIVHFDLKSDNLLVNLRDPHRPICKVGDLGLSKVKCQTLISGGVRGTLPWMAPELLNGSSSLVSEKVDVFSFGMVMWELLTGDEPYGDLHYGAIIGGIVSNTLRPPVPETCDQDWKALMERCWSSDPSKRPTFTEIANQLRVIASKVPPRVQNQQSPLSPQMQVKS